MQWFIFGILALVFVISPYQKGLYFTDAFYPVSLIILFLFIVLIIRLVLYKEFELLKTSTLLLLLPLCLLISTPFAESPSGAIDALIKWTTYIALFFLLFWCNRNGNIRKWMPIVFTITGIWISLHAILVYDGLLNFPNSMIAERFAGVFQYPNTFGMMMTVFIFFSLSMLMKGKNSIPFIIFYVIPLVLSSVGFVLSYSRGMYLIVPIVWFVGLLAFSVKKQAEYIVYTLIAVLMTLPIVSYDNQHDAIHLGLLGGSIPLSAVLFIFVKRLFIKKVFKLNRIERLWDKKVSRFILPGFVLLIGFLGLLDLKSEGLVYQALPTELQDRVESINVNSGTATERFIFFEDAIEMSKGGPFFGNGGESWATIYKIDQQVPYTSNKIHNGYLEWLVDTGWAGMLVFVLVFGSLLWQILLKVQNEEENAQYIAIFLSLLTIFAHSFIDFNFSYSSVWFAVFWLICMGISANRENTGHLQWLDSKIASSITKVGLGIFAVLALGCFVGSFSFFKATQVHDEAKSERNLLAKVELLESTTNKNPWNIDYQNELGAAYANLAQNYDADFQNQAMATIERLTGLEPNNYSVWLKAAALSKKLGDPKQTISYYEEALKHAPYEEAIYQLSIVSKVNYALNHADAQPFYAQSAIKDFRTYVETYEKLLEDESIPQIYKELDPKVTGNIHYYASLAHYLNNDFASIIDVYERNKSQSFSDIRVAAMAVLAYEEMNDVNGLKALYEKNDSQKLSVKISEIREMVR